MKEIKNMIPEKPSQNAVCTIAFPSIISRLSSLSRIADVAANLDPIGERCCQEARFASFNGQPGEQPRK
jgi:hypothetical protein